jgi:hypothetical protein
VFLDSESLYQHIMQHVSHEGFWQTMASGDYVLKRLPKSKQEPSFDICLPPSSFFLMFRSLSFSGVTFVTTFAMIWNEI